jgi:hypothetical protein
VLFALLFGVAGVVFARTPKPIPDDLANQMKTSTAKYVFVLLNNRRDNKQNVYVFWLVANKVATYFEMGSVIETPPGTKVQSLSPRVHNGDLDKDFTSDSRQSAMTLSWL